MSQQPKISLSTEELALSLVLCGYDEVAAGVLKSGLGEKSENDLQVVFETASHSLLSKELLLGINEENLAESLHPIFKQMMDLFVQSTKMIRCNKEANGAEEVLMLHRLPGDESLKHEVKHDVVHEFSILKESEIQPAITSFLKVLAWGEIETAHIPLTEELFNRLVEETKTEDELAFLCESFHIHHHQEMLKIFLSDFNDYGRRFANISESLISLKEYSQIQEAHLILPIHKRLWVVYNENEDINEPPSLVLKRMNQDQWIDHLEHLLQKGKLSL
ncbi:hypothetical protein [Priestia filamentosa]|uniref:Uncharacterized protein n=1 Tax=Priestia filamentosa TaxID=1402861 RepID=A0A0H4KS07_9BACI|nr:hypothetical protein [Priestia filamentosa]AKO91068.1 hypothetical protein BEH_02385 [Priestia filamentosa]AVD54392.1 hypothetical protein CKF96_02420 [Priestia filamentosa]MDT3765660.1 hypothetical protein [Priestia filamentosa]RJS65572.1 hypothetical protein CJ485_12730 [Priestia filamentosa]WRU95662.1 hypothetical protein RYX51_00705 [Priestia filamentosa]